MADDAALSGLRRDAAPVRLGVIGLGRGFVLSLPGLLAEPRIEIRAGCDPRADARRALSARFGAAVSADAARLCARDDVDAVYVASPHGMHFEHVLCAAEAGKHVLVEKPMAVELEHARRMVEACAAAGVWLLVGPSHGFDAPVLKARELIASGELGRPRMLHALQCTDFMYRPRRAAELDSGAGGLWLSQAIHQIDTLRVLVGEPVTRVTARSENCDASRGIDGMYSALIDFRGGAFASLTYSGYGRFDSDRWQGWIAESGALKAGGNAGLARARLAAGDEDAGKVARGFGPRTEPVRPRAHEHFGPTLVFCERGDLRITPFGVHVYADAGERFESCPHGRPRAAVIEALIAAVRHNVTPMPSGEWGLASLEVCHALASSAARGVPIDIIHRSPQ